MRRYIIFDFATPGQSLGDSAYFSRANKYIFTMYDIKPSDNFVFKFEQTIKECWDATADVIEIFKKGL